MGAHGLNDQPKTMLREILTRLVRLELRLEEAGILKPDYGDPTLLFALENGIPLERVPNELYSIPPEFYQRVWRWMEEHEDDSSATYSKLAFDMSDGNGLKARQTEILIILQFFALARLWSSALRRVVSESHPGMLVDIRKMIDQS